MSVIYIRIYDAAFYYTSTDLPTPFILDGVAVLSELPRGVNEFSITGVCGVSSGRLPTNELSNQHFL